jgi:hypothetical protein
MKEDNVSRADELRAELAMAELEDELVKLKKAKSGDPKKLREVKNRLREARRVSRQAREGN